jgi:hypothetical protein
MTDGSNHSSSLLYNSKLQPTHFEISGNFVSQSYDYYNDGRLKFIHNTTDPNFDRSYSYDHLARLTIASSGSSARGNVSGDTPYRETFGYDALSNLTERDTATWDTYNLSDFGSYTNNRRAGWGYDADGRNTTIGNRTTTFEAARRQIQMSAPSQCTTINSYNARNQGTNLKHYQEAQAKITSNPITMRSHSQRARHTQQASRRKSRWRAL